MAADPRASTACHKTPRTQPCDCANEKRSVMTGAKVLVPGTDETIGMCHMLNRSAGSLFPPWTPGRCLGLPHARISEYESDGFELQRVKPLQAL
jgi:hypothetical protein